MEDKISIIIPIYNVEKYLSKCLDSVCNQSYKNIEIVFYRENFEGQSKNKRDRSKNYQTIVETYQNKLKEINNDDELEQVLFNYIGYFTKNIIKDKIRWKDYRYIIKNRDELAQLLLKNNNYKYKILGNILKLL